MEEEEFTFGLLYFYNKTLRDTDLLFYSPLCLPVYSGTDKLLRYNTERHGKKVKKAVLKKKTIPGLYRSIYPYLSLYSGTNAVTGKPLSKEG